LILTKWRTPRDLIADSVLVSIMALLLASYHQPYHFTWVIPLLTLYYILNRDSTMLYCVLLAGAFLASLGFDTTNSTLIILQPLFAAIFYAAKATYIIRINHHAMSDPTLISHGPTLVESHR
jgi:hypothetical protein